MISFKTNDSIGISFNVIYYISLILLGSFFMLNLVLGVLSGEFAKEREKVEGRAAFLKLRRAQQMEKEIDIYIDWISRAEEAILREKTTTEQEKRHIMTTRRDYEMKKMKEGGKESEPEEDNLDDIDYAFKPKKKKGKKPPKKPEEEILDPGELKKAKILKYKRMEREFRLYVKTLIKTQVWYWTVIMLVFLNAVCAALEHYNQPDWLTNYLFYTEIGFLCMFISEMSIKYYCLGNIVYFRSSFNKFDCLVISGSVFEIFVNVFYPDVSYGISVLRSLRLLRVFKVTQYWMSLRNLVVSLINSMRSIISLLFLLFLFILIFALLGMQLFGGT